MNMLFDALRDWILAMGTSGAILSFAAAVGLLGLLVPRVLSLGGSRT